MTLNNVLGTLLAIGLLTLFAGKVNALQLEISFDAATTYAEGSLMSDKAFSEITFNVYTRDRGETSWVATAEDIPNTVTGSVKYSYNYDETLFGRDTEWMVRSKLYGIESDNSVSGFKVIPFPKPGVPVNLLIKDSVVSISIISGQVTITR